MKILKRESFDEYCRLLRENEVRAVKGFSGKVRKAAVAFMNAEDEESRTPYREAIVMEVFGRVDKGMATAQFRADDMFRSMTGDEPAPHEGANFDKCEARVRSAANHLFEHGDVDAFLHALEFFITGEVRAAASMAMDEND